MTAITKNGAASATPTSDTSILVVTDLISAFSSSPLSGLQRRIHRLSDDTAHYKTRAAGRKRVKANVYGLNCKETNRVLSPRVDSASRFKRGTSACPLNEGY